MQMTDIHLYHQLSHEPGSSDANQIGIALQGVIDLLNDVSRRIAENIVNGVISVHLAWVSVQIVVIERVSRRVLHYKFSQSIGGLSARIIKFDRGNSDRIFDWCSAQYAGRLWWL